jgi:hypothetical protein
MPPAMARHRRAPCSGDEPAPDFDTSHDAAVLDALQMLESTLRGALGPEMLFVTVIAFPDGSGGLQIQRASNCDRIACDLLRMSIELPDRPGARFRSTLRQ